MDPRQLFPEGRPSSPQSIDDANISVFLRLRPLSFAQPALYQVVDNVIEVQQAEERTDRHVTERQFTFTKIFDEEASQKQIYDRVVYPMVKDVLNTSGATFLAYGSSGSGKTYTVIGTQDVPGIIPRAIAQLFSQFEGNVATEPILKTNFKNGRDERLFDDETYLEKLYSQTIFDAVADATETYNKMLRVIADEHHIEKLIPADLDKVYFFVSFTEIYKEVTKDLLELKEKKTLRVISNGGDSFIQNANWVFAATPLECLLIMEYGLRLAHFGNTGVNELSSRSHMNFFINVIPTFTDGSVGHMTYKFCDLAGSERSKKTHAAGERLAEANKINVSLVTLGRCLQTIHSNQLSGTAAGLVPVRDSKLTLLLQSALLGAEKLSMIVNVYPTKEYSEENLNVLNFSAVAKSIVVKKPAPPKKRRSTIPLNFPLRRSFSVSEPAYDLDELEDLRSENLALRQELFAQEAALRKELVDNFSELGNRKDEYYKELMEKKLKRAENRYELNVAHLKKQHEEDIEELESMIERRDKKN